MQRPSSSSLTSGNPAALITICTSQNRLADAVAIVEQLLHSWQSCLPQDRKQHCSLWLPYNSFAQLQHKIHGALDRSGRDATSDRNALEALSQSLEHAMAKHWQLLQDDMAMNSF
jgi:hypothetical protein